ASGSRAVTAALPSGGTCPPSSTPARGVLGARCAVFRARNGAGWSRRRRRRAVADRGRVVERRAVRARLLRPGAQRRRSLPVLSRGRVGSLVRRRRLRLSADVHTSVLTVIHTLAIRSHPWASPDASPPTFPTIFCETR